MMICIGLVIVGIGDIFFLLATIGGAAILIGIFCFGFNIFLNTGKQKTD